jgi:hypothetical protein
VSGDNGTRDNASQIGYEILSYLLEHPDAMDTLEGIVRWWLMEQNIRRQTSRVRRALDDLVNSGFVFEQKMPHSGTGFRLNRDRYEEILSFLQMKL